MPNIDTVIANFNLGLKGEGEIKKGIQVIEQYQKEADQAKKGTMEWMEAQNKLKMAQKSFAEELERSNKSVDGFNKKIDSNQQSFNKFGGSLSSLAKSAGPALAAIFAVDKLIEYGKEILKIEKQYNVLFKTVKRFSDLEGRALTDASTRIQALAKVYNKNTDELVTSINNFAKQTETDFVDALTLVEKGFIQGADSSGDFLSNLEEYPVQFKNAKRSAEDFVRFAVQEVRGGVFDDKLLDAVKELGLRLRELDQAQRDALKPLGEEFSGIIIKDLEEGSRDIIDIFKEIILQAKSAGLNTQQLQKLVADLGGGALEDLGGLEEAFKQIDAAMKINLDTTDELGERQKRLLEESKALADEEARLAQNLEGLSDAFGSFFTQLQTQGLSTLNNIIEALQRLSDEAAFIDNKALRFEIENNTEIVKQAESVKELQKVIVDAQEELALLNTLSSNADFFGDTQGVERYGKEIEGVTDRIEKARVRIKELNKTVNEEPEELSEEQKNQISLFMQLVDSTREYGKALSEVEMNTLTKAIEERAKAVKAYANLAKDIELAFREAEADFLDSDVLRFELKKDKILANLEKDIQEIKTKARAAGVTDIELNAQIEIAEDTARIEIQAALEKLNRELEKGQKDLQLDIPTSPAGTFDLAGRDIADTEKVRQQEEAQRKLLIESEQEDLERRKQIYADFYNNLRFAVLDFTNFQISQLDREINYREGRIDYLSGIQSESAERALEEEKRRQDEALQRQQGFVSAQRTIAAVETGINFGVGISKIFAETGIGAVGAVPVVLGVLGGLLAGIPALVSSSLPAFKEGIVDFKGIGTTTSDDNLIKISNRESVITAKGTSLAPEALKLINQGKLSDREIFADLSPLAVGKSGYSPELEKEIKKSNEMMYSLISKVSNPEIHKLFLNEKGYSKLILKRSERLNKIRNNA